MSSTSGKIGRNDPCPCGSGKKYKRCCLAKGALNRNYSQAERMSVRTKLEVFTSTDANIDVKEAAANTYWGPFIDEMGELAEQGLLDQSEDAFNAWLWFDYRISDGRRMVDSFLEDEPSLTAGERAYLERMRYSAVRLYEVEAVVPGFSVTLHDMLSARSIRVRERLGSQSMKRWDVIAARLTPMGASGEPEIEDVISLPRFQVTSIVDTLREELTSWRNARQDAEDLAFFERNARVVKKLIYQDFNLLASGKIAPPAIFHRTPSGAPTSNAHN